MARVLVEEQTIRNNTGTSNKEWTYRIDRDTDSGRYVTSVWWGRIGTAGQGQQLWDDVLSTAQARMIFKLRDKLAAGYWRFDARAGTGASIDAIEAVRQRGVPAMNTALQDEAVRLQKAADRVRTQAPARARADPEPVSFIRKIKLKD
jgi:hypothetical protein